MYCEKNEIRVMNENGETFAELFAFYYIAIRGTLFKRKVIHM